MTAQRTARTELRTVSYGGGVQSTSLLALAATGKINFHTFLFANVGDDSEHPDTLRYVREIAAPYAERHGIELVELHRHRRDGTTETLRGRLMREGSRSIPIPMRMSGNGAPGTRSCTADFKIRVVAKELKRRGATVENPATVAIGISVDELERAKPGVDDRMPYQFRTYPLLDLGLHRSDCRRIIEDAGLPVPPKSSCYFCPYHDTEAWRRLKRDTPALFDDSCHIEITLNERRAMLGRDPMWMHRSLRPLRESVDDQAQLPGLGDDCDSGWCFT